ncbi:MAG: MCE family protein [Bacteroidetes bacterium]|nr:MCE family protein [Bacteroidota bacterium]MCH8941561.1 MCE family protein [Bacteroidota bacterium]
MKRERKSEIKVGITVTIGILIFIWVLGWAKNFSFTSNYKTLKVQFENTSGLIVGDNVTVNGVKKGFVDDITLHENGVILSLTIENEVHLYKDASFKIAMLDLMGGKKVEISSGMSGIELDYKKLYHGKFLNDFPALIADLGKIQNNVANTLLKLDITLTNVNELLGDKEFKAQLKSSVSNMNNVSIQFSELLNKNKNLLNNLISNANSLTVNADSMLKENRENIKSTLYNLNTLSLRADTLFQLSNNFMVEIKNQENNLGKMIYNKLFYTNLDSTLIRLNELTKLLIMQLKDDGINVDASIF